MNVFIVTLLWVVGIALAIVLLFFVLSGFEFAAILYGGFFMALFLPGILWLLYSFLLGYTGGKGWLTALPVMLFLLVIYGFQSLLSYAGQPTCLEGAFFSNLLGIGIACVLFIGVGVLCRYGVRQGIYVQWATYLFGSAAAVFGFYLVLAFLTRQGSVLLIEEKAFWRPPYAEVQKDGTVLIRDKRLFINPFPSRVIGVFSYNDRGEYCGLSVDDYEEHKITKNDLDDQYARDSISTAVLVHNNYLPSVRTFLSDCREALYVKNDSCAVLLYLANDTLRRKEFDYHKNGLIRQMRSYVYQGRQGFHIEEEKTKEFDELGYAAGTSLFFSWHYKDFVTVDEAALNIEAAFGKAYTPLNGDYSPRQQEIIEKYLRVTKNEPDTTQSIDPSALEMPLDEYYQLGGINGKTISIHIDTKSYRWKYPEPHHFEALKEIPPMDTIIAALDLCRLEPGMWERVGEQSMLVGTEDQCYRILIWENKSTFDIGAKEEGAKKNASAPSATKENGVVFYLFDKYAVTADSRFLFRFDPTLHTDPKLQEKARTSWEQMMKIFEEHKNNE